MPPTTTATVEIAKQILGLIGQQDPLASGGVEEVGRALRACSRDQLLTFARQLGLAGVTKLAKDALAGRVAAALDASRGAASTPAGNGHASPTGTLSAKFDLGPDVGDDGGPAQTIPWGYGGDRVTAMTVDPTRLYVYWEVTDAAIAAARKQLDAGGADAWLSLRVYDITGRLFDGTNAHSYFDEGVGRDVRQWFFEIGKPTSTACVEIGLKSKEGFFVKIARSGRVEFARAEPEAAGPVEWLTVRTATGHAGEAVVGGAPQPDGYAAPAFGGGAAADDWQGWTDGAGFPVPGGGMRVADGATEWREVSDETVQSQLGEQFTTGGRVEWLGPVYRSEWQAGPFEQPLDAPLSMLEHHETGEVSMRSEGGVVHVVYGPWQVVIRGAGARSERRVLATWEYRRTVELPGGFERNEAVDGVDGRWEPVAPGASEWRYVGQGASERRWLGASELMFRGGSEVWMMGASERLFRGASERLRRGASERLYRGASERLLRGASERLLRGASERHVGGASERLVTGRLGASENTAVPSSSASTSDSDDAASPYPRPER